MSPDERATAIATILSSAPDILLFKHWHWLTGRDVPRRMDRETNAEYLKKHWSKLKRAARQYKEI